MYPCCRTTSIPYRRVCEIPSLLFSLSPTVKMLQFHILFVMVLLVFLSSFRGSDSFLFQSQRSFFSRSKGKTRTTSIYLVEDDQELILFGNCGVSNSTESISSTTHLMESLQRRQQAIEQGIGKRYVTRTQLGFLNIHYEPTNPHDTNNIVGRLEQGQIVTSTGPMRGLWIKHDGGGWSISKYGGFTWLEPIDE